MPQDLCLTTGMLRVLESSINAFLHSSPETSATDETTLHDNTKTVLQEWFNSTLFPVIKKRDTSFDNALKTQWSQFVEEFNAGRNYIIFNGLPVNDIHKNTEVHAHALAVALGGHVLSENWDITHHTLRMWGVVICCGLKGRPPMFAIAAFQHDDWSEFRTYKLHAYHLYVYELWQPSSPHPEYRGIVFTDVLELGLKDDRWDSLALFCATVCKSLEGTGEYAYSGDSMYIGRDGVWASAMAKWRKWIRLYHPDAKPSVRGGYHDKKHFQTKTGKSIELYDLFIWHLPSSGQYFHLACYQGGDAMYFKILRCTTPPST